MPLKNKTANRAEPKVCQSVVHEQAITVYGYCQACRDITRAKQTINKIKCDTCKKIVVETKNNYYQSSCKCGGIYRYI